MSDNGAAPQVGEPFPLSTLRHSVAHLMASAVGKLYPGVQFGIGPSIEHGFYYDFEFPEPITEKDLKRIEKEMRKIAKKDKEIADLKKQLLAARADPNNEKGGKDDEKPAEEEEGDGLRSKIGELDAIIEALEPLAKSVPATAESLKSYKDQRQVLRDKLFGTKPTAPRLD